MLHALALPGIGSIITAHLQVALVQGGQDFRDRPCGGAYESAGGWAALPSARLSR